MTGLLSRPEPVAGFYRVAFSALAAGVLTLGLAAPALAQDTPDELPEHPVIKPMNGATLLEDSSRADDFGQLLVRYRLDGKTIDETAEGRFWHLEYQLEIVDEAGLDLSLEFDAAAMLQALTRDGKVTIYGILFDVNRADLRPGSGEVIDTVAEVLKANPDLRIEVQGHTDSTGAAERNRELSLDRAQSVAAALRLYGVEANRLVPRGFGPDQPVADNADEQGRQQNRRVELVRIE